MGMFSGIEISDRAQQLLEKSVIIDGRDPTFLMYRFTSDDKPEYWDSVRQSGITSICVDPAWVDDGIRDTALSFAGWYKRIRANNAILALSAEDIRRAKREKKMAFVLNLQSPTPVENELDLVEVLQRMGLRIMQLAYQRRNYLAEGVGELTSSGLSKFGFEVVEEMNRVGVIADLAHATEKTMRDVLKHSKQPVINSHSAVRSIVDHPRNMSDELLKVLADKGGVYCVSAYSAFLKQGGAQTGSTLADWIRHVDYLVKLIGADHVGFGFDVGEARSQAEVNILNTRFKEAAGASPELRYVKELRSRRNFPVLVEAMVQAKFSDEVIEKVLGKNLLRVFEEVWRA